MQNWPCCEHIVEDWWSEAVARLEPSKCSKSVDSCGGTANRNTAWQCPFFPAVVPVSGNPRLHFLQLWYRKAGPFWVPDSGPKIGTAIHQSVRKTRRGRKMAPILGPESGTRNGSIFGYFFVKNAHTMQKNGRLTRCLSDGASITPIAAAALPDSPTKHHMSRFRSKARELGQATGGR